MIGAVEVVCSFFVSFVCDTEIHKLFKMANAAAKKAAAGKSLPYSLCGVC